MWIVSGIQTTEASHLPVFYKRFQAKKGMIKCTLNASALGIFCVKINGREIKDYFMPGWTNYNKYVHICSYDITADIQEENLLEITLAEGWFSGRLGYTTKANVYGKENALFAQVEMEFADGNKVCFATDDTWRVGNSNILSSSLFDGEWVDFTTPTQDVDSLPFATIVQRDTRFEPYTYEPTRKIGCLKPITLYRDDRVLRLDFKQNFAGFLTFKARGKRGDKLTIRHAEMLNPDGSLYYENLRSVKATDTVVLSGDIDTFDPKFTFHGFRYAEITMEGEVEIFDLQGTVLSQDIDYSGSFACSDEIVNAVYNNVLWGQKSNFISIPTDCPQRDERLGWTGDAQVFCNSAMFNGDCNAFFANYLKLIRTDILPDGKVPSFAPFFIPVSVSTAGVPGWADVICVLPYYHYLHYGDKRVIEDNLPDAVRHLQYYLSKCDGYLMGVENPFGDWLSVVKADDIPCISQCFLGLSAMLISKMYGILEDKENAEIYSQVYEGAKAAFRAAYWQADGKIKGDSQTIYALSYAVGFMLADEIRAPFLESIQRNGGKLTTGFIGVKYLLPALCDVGAADVAYKIIKETEYPSWGYTIKNGATTIWERWNGYTTENGFETPSMNSFNHYSLGSCVEWLYAYVLGIKLSEDGTVCISPSFSEELTWAKGAYKARKGMVYVDWRLENGQFHVKAQADKDVALTYDFKGWKVLSIMMENNCLEAVLQ